MSLEKQLQDLRKQKREAVRTLHVTYIRTKRDVKRAVSPDRIIRRNLAASLGIAAVAGLMLAPRSGDSQRKAKKAGRGAGSFIPSWLKGVIRKFIPQLGAYVPGVEEAAGSGAATATPEEAATTVSQPAAEHVAEKAHGVAAVLRPFLMEIAMMLLSKIDLQRIIAQLIHSFSGRQAKANHPSQGEKSGEEHEAGHGEGPDVTVADAGTVHDPAPDA